MGSVGSSQWMTAEVNGLTVHYGLFERCVTNTANDVTICDAFDWPGWLYDRSQGKTMGIFQGRIIWTFSSVMTPAENISSVRNRMP